jgi:hypothetical protein
VHSEVDFVGAQLSVHTVGSVIKTVAASSELTVFTEGLLLIILSVSVFHASVIGERGT